MNSGTNRVLDELAKLVTDAAGAAQGVRREMETAFRAQAERLLNSMDVVQREDFDAVREMAVRARTENSALTARIEALEARLAKIEGEQAAKTAKSSSAATKSKDNS
ncbi:accessory factor UbiK family protein [Brucella sp. IR073]|uniref:accessory factor UbiK family protein n=1 Tax=unclassified Brucella TaxID=2632610 RepID=UPI003B9829AB